jgi:hypothetical protein
VKLRLLVLELLNLKSSVNYGDSYTPNRRRKGKVTSGSAGFPFEFRVGGFLVWSLWGCGVVG